MANSSVYSSSNPSAVNNIPVDYKGDRPTSSNPRAAAPAAPVSDVLGGPAPQPVVEEASPTVDETTKECCGENPCTDHETQAELGCESVELTVEETSPEVEVEPVVEEEPVVEDVVEDVVEEEPVVEDVVEEDGDDDDDDDDDETL